MKKILLFSLVLTLLGISRGWSQTDEVERINVSTPTSYNKGYSFTSEKIEYSTRPCNKLRFTLTDSKAYYSGNKNYRFSLDYFELRDANGKKVELTADCFSGNYVKEGYKIYANMLDGVNNTLCNGWWYSADEGHDYFDIKLPANVDLGGAFSFYYVTEKSTNMEIRAFAIDVMYVERYTINVNSPGGVPVDVVYDGTVINPANGIEVGFDVNKFSVSDIGGYTWDFSVDDEAKTVTLTYTEISELANTVVKSVSAEPVSTLEEGAWYIMLNDFGNVYAYDDGSGLRSSGANAMTEVGAGTPISKCARALFTLSEGKDAITIGDRTVTGYRMKWGTGRYTKWRPEHNKQMLTSKETPDDTYGWVYASSTKYNDVDVFHFMKNTDTQFSNGFADIAAGKNIFIQCQGADAAVVDYSQTAYTINTIGENGKNVWKVYKVELETRTVDVAISLKKKGEDQSPYTEHLKLPVGSLIKLKEHVPNFSFITYGDENAEVGETNNSFDLSYEVDEEAERAFPFATSVEGLDEVDADGNNKWFSMFTLNGRMHVYDDTSEGNIFYYDSEDQEYKIERSEKKYPTIDKATFTRLNSNFFWGFVRKDRFSPTYIYNKGAGTDKTLYLTANGDNQPLLFTDKYGHVHADNWVTNKWALVKGSAVTENGTEIQYYGIKASGTDEYICNYNNNGYMTTSTKGPGSSSGDDNGSNFKLTPKLVTYDILRERALNAPCDAVHSLNSTARQEVKVVDKDIADNPSLTIQEKVSKYETVIRDINDDHTDAGFVQYEDGAYYYIRNYTPENEDVRVLASTNGSDLCTLVVPSGEDNNQAGTADVAMTYSNINAIWKIKESDISYGEVPGTGIGASRTIARKVTHANSSNQLGSANNPTLTNNGANYYFVDLGAGQHFMKNVQYNGSGRQASAKPLSCTSEGTVVEGSEVHKKNTRDAWYCIRVTEILVTLPANGGGYATICLPFGVSFKENREGLTAYAVTSVSGGVATLEGSGYIPANQGAILKGEAGRTYKLTINDEENGGAGETTVWSKNKLKGSCMATNISESAYVLSNPGNGVGLYRAAETSGTWLNNANKAYLPASEVPGASGARFLSFDFGTETGLDVISGTESTSAESVVYDLSGRRVRTAQKGMYIVNGQKVVK